MRLELFLVLCTACGRLDFGTVCDNRVGHDEDGDGIDDACDVCPNLDNNQRDSDGDGIGDACDPQPTTPTESLALFDPFLVRTTAWGYGAVPVVGNDVMTIAGVGRTVTPQLNSMPGHDRFILVGTVSTLGTAMNHQLSIQISPGATMGGYYCELYEGNGSVALGLTSTPDYINYTVLDRKQIGTTLANASFRLTFDHAPPDLACSVSWQGTQYAVAAPVPAGFPAAQIYIAVNDLDVSLTSFARISSTP